MECIAVDLVPVGFAVPFDIPVGGIGANLVALAPVDAPDIILGHFELFWTDAIMDQFVKATNSFANLRRIREWKDVNRAEFKAFIGIVIYLGYNTYPSRRDAWNTGPTGSNFIRQVMSLHRFNSILRSWHYEDYGDYPDPVQLAALKAGDPFWAVQSFCGALSSRFKELWTPSQRFDIDEQCIPWKGRHKCRCYNPSKPEKWHFKVQSINCSITGYQIDFYLYAGKAEQRPPQVSATAYPAYRLLLDPRLHNRGHILFTDNWFTSFEQLHICVLRGIEMVGTVRSNRSGIPAAPVRVRGQPKPVRGEYTVKETIFEGKETFFTTWHDNKPVNLLHTVPTFRGICNRQVKEVNGWFRREYGRPTIVCDYNEGMGGTDAGDQRMECYRPHLKTISWIPRIFSHFLNATVVDCFILCKHSNNASLPSKHLLFRSLLVDNLIKEHLESKVLETGPRPLISMSKKKNGNHKYPVELEPIFQAKYSFLKIKGKKVTLGMLLVAQT